MAGFMASPMAMPLLMGAAGYLGGMGTRSLDPYQASSAPMRGLFSGIQSGRNLSQLQMLAQNAQVQRDQIQRQLEAAKTVLNLTQGTPLEGMGKVAAATGQYGPVMNAMAPQAPKQRRIITGPDGNPYYVDEQGGFEPVLPGVTPPPAPMPEQKPLDASQLRKEYTSQSKAFIESRNRYEQVRTAPNTGAGDITRVFSLMKLLDPESTVQQGEQATANNAAGVPGWLMGQYNRLLGGGTMSPQARKDIDNEVARLFDQRRKRQLELESQYQNIAQYRGFDPSIAVPDYFGDLREWQFQPSELPAQAAPPPVSEVPVTEEQEAAARKLLKDPNVDKALKNRILQLPGMGTLGY